MKLTEDTSVRYLTNINDKLGGPYTSEGLESLVYLHKISPDTLISREGNEDFKPIKATPLGPILFPKAVLQTTPQDWAPPRRENDPAFTSRKNFRLTKAKFEKVNAQAGKLPKIDVYNILDEIRQTEIESGRDFVRSNRFRISRRTIDFWIVAIAGNTLILAGSIYMQNTASMMIGIGSSGLFTFGLLWSMYGVMDRY